MAQHEDAINVAVAASLDFRINTVEYCCVHTL